MNPLKAVERLLGSEIFDYLEEKDKHGSEISFATIKRMKVGFYGAKSFVYEAEYVYEDPDPSILITKKDIKVFSNEFQAYSWLQKSLAPVKLKQF